MTSADCSPLLLIKNFPPKEYGLLCCAGTVTQSTQSTLSISTAIGGSALRAIDWTLDFKRLWSATPQTTPIIGHSNQDHAAGGIGKGAYLTPKLGSARALELDGIAFAKGGQLSEVFFVNIDHCPFLRRVIGDESLHETMGIFDILGVYRRTLALGRIVAQIADGLDGPPHRLTVQIVSKEVICLTEPRPIFLLVFPKGTCRTAKAAAQHGR